MRAVVTGGAGFIGSHVVEALLERGDEVHVLDDLSKGSARTSPAAPSSHEADIRDPDAVFAAVAPGRPSSISRRRRTCASRSSGPTSTPTSTSLGTVRVLEAARAHGAKVVFASTGGAIYGECDGPATETAPRRPLAPYGTSKLCGEEYLATWNRLYGTRARLAPVRERLRAAPGSARRGRRRRDLHGAPARRAARRRSTATAARRATTCSSATSRARCSPRPSTPAASSTSARASRRPSSSSTTAIQRASGVTREPAFARRGSASCSEASSTSRSPSASSAGVPSTRSTTGSRATWAWVEARKE